MNLWPMIAVLAAAAGCSAQTAVPSGSTSTPQFASSRLSSAQLASKVASIRRKSRIDAAKRHGQLLYVADSITNAVLVYTYPELSGAGELSGFASVDGVCTDRRGYVWVLDTSDVAVWEFAHGGTQPINSLNPGSPSNNPGVSNGCAVNPKTGDLAVAGFAGITVFHNGQETHDTYMDFRMFQFTYIGYDGANNLYADGRVESDFAFGLDLLAAGSTNLSIITLSGGSVASPGGIQWDGKYLDIADSGSGNVYQTSGSAILNTIVTGASCQGQFYVFPNRRRMIDPDPCSADTGIYRYLAGGSALKKVTGGQQAPSGAAISNP